MTRSRLPKPWPMVLPKPRGVQQDLSVTCPTCQQWAGSINDLPHVDLPHVSNGRFRPVSDLATPQDLRTWASSKVYFFDCGLVAHDADLPPCGNVIPTLPHSPTDEFFQILTQTA